MPKSIISCQQQQNRENKKRNKKLAITSAFNFLVFNSGNKATIEIENEFVLMHIAKRFYTPIRVTC
ncbi:hypothetical protein BpHYR1_000354 [Brachionus plicatilis]|uniref:Uncharacterized protein n=1 Tax=Brachionus plicatilis TaxID=10195 RepID=A0A3M7SCV7_BRAPC|nr:hypothetical protein BpHYR1_000354 [Brachionus plicatilis]